MKTTKKLKRMVAGVLASLMAMSGTANICAADTEGTPRRAYRLMSGNLIQ